jgi:hypothetical protein
MQPKIPPEEPPNPSRKEWRPPHCYRKSWQTPKFVSLEFSQTRGGDFAFVPETSSGSLAGS